MRAVIHCPDTGNDFEIELPASPTVVAEHWRRSVSTRCPHCRKEHLEVFRDLFSRAVIDSNVDRTSLAHMAFRRYR